MLSQGQGNVVALVLGIVGQMHVSPSKCRQVSYVLYGSILSPTHRLLEL